LQAAGSRDAVVASFDCVQKIQEGEQAGGSLYQIEYLRTGPEILTVYQLATLGETAPAPDDRKRMRSLIGFE
jgi:hypothetical protein